MQAEEAFALVREEFEQVEKKVRPLNSRHEGLGVLLEEFEELKEAIYDDEQPYRIVEEATQVAAVAVRILVHCVGERRPDLETMGSPNERWKDRRYGYPQKEMRPTGVSEAIAYAMNKQTEREETARDAAEKAKEHRDEIAKSRMTVIGVGFLDSSKRVVLSVDQIAPELLAKGEFEGWVVQEELARAAGQSGVAMYEVVDVHPSRCTIVIQRPKGDGGRHILAGQTYVPVELSKL